MDTLIPRAHRAVGPVAPAGKQERAALRTITNTTGGAQQQQIQRKRKKVAATTTATATTATATATTRAKAQEKKQQQENANPNPTKKPRRAQVAGTLHPKLQPTCAPGSDTSMADVEDVSMLDEKEDIDANDSSNQAECPEYATDIINYLLAKEKHGGPSATYLSAHKEVNESMRTILVNWMIEVHMEFQTETETLFIAVSILDRYLERTPTLSRKKLQLVGMTALFVACKYEQTYLPSVEDFVEMADNAYTMEEVLGMENEILRVIDWNFSFPTPSYFLKRFAKAAHFVAKMEAFSSYFAELTIPEYAMLAYPPSLIAAASVFITRRLNGLEPSWNQTLQHYTGYREEELRPCAKAIIHILKKEAQRFQKAEDINDNRPCTVKYAKSKYHSVAPQALARVGRNAAARTARNQNDN